MSSIKQMIKDKKFWFFTLISILFFGVLIKMEYATDTYAVFETSSRDVIKHFLISGRFVTGGAYAIVKLLNINNIGIYIISFLMAIFCTSIAIYELDFIFKENIKSNSISIISSILIIINIFSIELYLFIEKGILMLSVLFSILAFKHIIKYFKGDKKQIIYTIIYMIFANFSYQGTVGIFLSLSFIYIVKYNKDIKSFIKNNIVAVVCYGIPAIFNYIVVKFIFINNRVSGNMDIALSIKKIIESSKEMFIKTYNIIPKYFFVTTVLALVFVIIYSIIRNKSNKKDRTWLILGVFYIAIGNIAVTILPQIMQATESIWFVPRSTYTFASLIGILVVYLFVNVDVSIKVEKILIILLVGYMSIQYVGFQNIIRDRYILNYMDSYTCLQIMDKLNNYEETSGNTITKASFYESEQKKYCYPNLYVDHDTNIKASFPEWSRLKALNYYLNKKLEESENNNEIYEKYFKDKNWNYFEKEQIIFENDTMHVFVY